MWCKYSRFYSDPDPFSHFDPTPNLQSYDFFNILKKPSFLEGWVGLGLISLKILNHQASPHLGGKSRFVKMNQIFQIRIRQNESDLSDPHQPHWCRYSKVSLNLIIGMFLKVVGLNFSSATTPELLLKTLDHYCEYRKTPNGMVLSPVQVGPGRMGRG